MSIKEQVKPLEWTTSGYAAGATHVYLVDIYLVDIDEDSRHSENRRFKYICRYCRVNSDEPFKIASGFNNADEAKEWAFNHHCEKMAKWIKPDLLSDTLKWFKIAKPEPTIKDTTTQIGCHYEEISEMSKALNCDYSESAKLARVYKSALEARSENYIKNVDSTELLDALVDQIVTAIGVGYMMGFDMIGALNEVNASNYSKFEDGKAVTDKNGKIIKGKDYFKPDLAKFLGVSDENI